MQNLNGGNSSSTREDSNLTHAIQAHDVYDIVKNNLSEISDIAASVGVDFPATYPNITFPCRLNSALTKSIDSNSDGRVGVIAETRYTRLGAEYPFLVFRSFRNSGETVTWSGFDAVRGVKTASLSDEDRLAAEKKRESARIQRETKARAAAKEKSTKALAKWRLMPVATNEQISYLNKKQITAITRVVSIRYGFDALCGEFIAHPLFSWDGNQVGYERISIEDSSNKAVSGGAGCDGVYFGFIQGDQNQPAVITEGFADAATIHLATGATVFVAISASNIRRIAELLHADGVDYYVATDNDKAGDNSVYSINVPTLAFARAPMGHKDWNDYHCSQGLDSVRGELNSQSRCSYVVSLDQRYLGDVLEDGFCNLVRSEKGTGKTSSLNSLLDRNETVLVVTYRQSLATKISQDCNLMNYLDSVEVEGASNIAHCRRLCVTYDSLHKVKRRDFGALVLDESEQGLDHMMQSSTMSRKRGTHSQLMTLCARANTVVMLDADVGNVTEEFTRSFNEVIEKPVNYIINSYLPRAVNGHKIHVYPSSNQVLALASQCVEKSFCFSDTVAGADSLYAAKSEDGLLITSETTAGIQTELSTISEHVKTINNVCASPSLGVGVSIDEGHGYTMGFGIFGGRTASVECDLQQMARFRGLGEFHINLGSNADSCNPTTANAVKKLYIDQAIESDVDVSCKFNSSELDAFSALYCEVIASRNKSKNSFSTHFINKARKEGFEIIFVQKDDDLIAGGKLFSDDITERNKEKKILKIEALTAEYVELGFDAEQAELIAAAESGKKLVSRVLKNTHTASLSATLANQIDKTEYADVNNGKMAKIQLSHTGEKRKLVIDVLRRVGVSYDGEQKSFVSNGIVWGSGSSKTTANWLKKSADLTLLHLGICKKRDYTIDTSKRFHELLATVGINVKTTRIGQSEREYSVCSDSLAMLNEILKNKSRFEDR